MATLHDGFSSAAFEPVAAPFRGFRAFLIDDHDPDADVTEVGHLGHAPAPTIKSFASHGGRAHGAKLRGSLRGIFMSDFYWGPGTNEAVCMSQGRTWSKVVPHGRIEPDCDCGFWAYTNGDHYLSVPGPAALGVVEAWGRMIVGPDGFRADRARIVALCFPKLAVDEPPTDTQANVQPLGFDHVLRQVTKVATQAASLMIARLGAYVAAASNQNAPAVGANVANVAVNRAARPWEKVDDDLKAAVRRLYPDVPIFESVAAMQQAFPLTDTRPLLPAPSAEPEPEKDADDA